ncbi:hypothetical protein CY34DRAFT_10331 [Suillus luteus UH-Slu-Lm8-n1]|uniref:Uncharacterized protein n=1 Tax=Suillus luteus UH-Slu-Lm8-n1 TaxID=930992 RepID=A0A0D0AV95_9AGAM|nr:hypothetical protein CY34DRAFT_10331 [Suillus luteus UH-Slu-Lm8-n1]
MAHDFTFSLPSAAPVDPALRSHLDGQAVISFPQIVKLLPPNAAVFLEDYVHLRDRSPEVNKSGPASHPLVSGFDLEPCTGLSMLYGWWWDLI